MANINVAVKKAESPAEKLARLERENAEMLNQLRAMKAAQGEFKLAVTVAREAGTNGPKDKGSKGGSLAISVGNSHIYPSMAVIEAVLEHAEEIREFIGKHAGELTR